MAQEVLKITDPKIAEQFHMYLPKNMTSNTNEKGQITYDPNSYIITSSKNIVSKRKAAIYGSANIILRGFSIVEHSCIIRGDLANIQCDVHVVLMPGVLLRPPIKVWVGDCVGNLLRRNFYFFLLEFGISQNFRLLLDQMKTKTYDLYATVIKKSARVQSPIKNILFLSTISGRKIKSIY